MRGPLVHCLDANLTIPVLVPVQLLLHDVELDVGGEAAEGFHTVIISGSTLVPNSLGGS